MFVWNAGNCVDQGITETVGNICKLSLQTVICFCLLFACHWCKDQSSWIYRHLSVDILLIVRNRIVLQSMQDLTEQHSGHIDSLYRSIQLPYNQIHDGPVSQCIAQSLSYIIYNITFTNEVNRLSHLIVETWHVCPLLKFNTIFAQVNTSSNYVYRRWWS